MWRVETCFPTHNTQLPSGALCSFFGEGFPLSQRTKKGCPFFPCLLGHVRKWRNGFPLQPPRSAHIVRLALPGVGDLSKLGVTLWSSCQGSPNSFHDFDKHPGSSAGESHLYKADLWTFWCSYVVQLLVMAPKGQPSIFMSVGQV